MWLPSHIQWQLPKCLLLAKSCVLWWACYRSTSLMATNHPLATDNLLGACFLGQGHPLGREDMLCEQAGVPTLILSLFSPPTLFSLLPPIIACGHCNPPSLPTPHCTFPPPGLPTPVTAIESKQTRPSCQNIFGGKGNPKIPPSLTEKARRKRAAH